MKNLKEFKPNKMTKALIIISGALTAVICLVMNLILIPQIESTTEGFRCFDMNSFGYTYEQAQQFLALLSEQGRNTYLHIQLPLDFVYPIAYCIFFSLAILYLSKRKTLLIAAPILLAAFDYTENICSIIMLKSTELSKSLASFASFVTVFKSVLMYISIGIILVYIVIRLVKRKK